VAKISFLSNIASLQAQRRLTENTKELSKTNERLSSGLRITRASDDAAGIAIAASLNVDGRVFTQAIRNLNDGISLSNVAEGGLAGLRDIVFRLRELGEQSANGVLTSVQRQSIEGEGLALISEYSRIISVTEFNGLKLLDGTLTNLTLQAGYGTAGELKVSIGQQLQRNLVGGGTSTTTADGTFQVATSYSTGGSPRSVTIGDINGDGNLDIITADLGAAKTSVLLGNGNGTFQARTSYSTGSNPYSVATGDVNGDGKLDIITADLGVNKTGVLLGNGNGTFQARTSYSTGSSPISVDIEDVNGDGKLDIVSADNGADKTSVFFGNGNGTFQARTSYSVGFGRDPFSVTLGELDGDGKLDIVVAGDSAKASVFLNNGNGTFKAKTDYTVGAGSNFIYSVVLGDLNGDGKLDIVATDASADKTSVLLGNGNGTFQARTSYTTGDNPRSVALGDINGDGKLDIVSADYSAAKTDILLGNGNGTFQARTSYSTGSNPLSVTLGDVNGDNALDIAVVAGSTDKADILIANTATTTTSTPISFLTQASSLAALTTLASVQTSIENELANIGAIQSRLGTALNNLRQTRENYQAAESRIVDVDVALESAELVKRQILQNASSAILAQANQEPGLLLRLLKP